MAVHILYSHKQRFFLWQFVVVLFALHVWQAGFAKAYTQTPTSQNSYKEFYNSGITHVDITLKDHIGLQIISTSDQTFKIIDSRYGEYQQAVLLTSLQRNDSLFITDPQNPAFTYPNDKLSAHKVIDGVATIYLPKGKTVFINAESADIILTGDFKRVTVNLKNGRCELNNMLGDFQIVTVYAPVVTSNVNATIHASTRNGTVTHNSVFKNARYKGKIESINGSITVN